MHQVGALIHKEKEAKRNQKAEGLLSVEPLSYRTIGEGNTPVNSTVTDRAGEPSSSGQQQLLAKERRLRGLTNAEIDEKLDEWIDTGLILESYKSWYAKACHQLGLAKINRIAIEALNGTQPQRLFATKVKARLNLLAKRELAR